MIDWNYFINDQNFMPDITNIHYYNDVYIYVCHLIWYSAQLLNIKNKTKVFGIKRILSQYIYTAMSAIAIKTFVRTCNYKESKFIKQNVLKINKEYVKQ